MGGTGITGAAGRRALGGAVVLALFALPVAACGGGGNAGGNTSCGTYQGLASSDRSTVVKAMIDQHGGNDSAAAIDVTKLSVDAYCALHTSSDTIGNVYKP